MGERARTFWVTQNFNIQDYNRIRQTVDLSRRVEEREKKERKSNYLEKLTDERRSDLMKIYGPKICKD